MIGESEAGPPMLRDHQQDTDAPGQRRPVEPHLAAVERERAIALEHLLDGEAQDPAPLPDTGGRGAPLRGTAAQDDLAARLAALEERVATLERHLARLGTAFGME